METGPASCVLRTSVLVPVSRPARCRSDSAHPASAACWPTPGAAAEFRVVLAARQLSSAVGSPPTQKVLPADVALARPGRKASGRPPKHPVASAAGVGAAGLSARDKSSRALRPLGGGGASDACGLVFALEDLVWG
jgi:hypothetical protein